MGPLLRKKGKAQTTAEYEYEKYDEKYEYISQNNRINLDASM